MVLPEVRPVEPVDLDPVRAAAAVLVGWRRCHEARCRQVVVTATDSAAARAPIPASRRSAPLRTVQLKLLRASAYVGHVMRICGSYEPGALTMTRKLVCAVRPPRSEAVRVIVAVPPLLPSVAVMVSTRTSVTSVTAVATLSSEDAAAYSSQCPSGSSQWSFMLIWSPGLSGPIPPTSSHRGGWFASLLTEAPLRSSVRLKFMPPQHAILPASHSPQL